MSVPNENMLLSGSHVTVEHDLSSTIQVLVNGFTSDDPNSVCNAVKKLAEEIEKGQDILQVPSVQKAIEKMLWNTHPSIFMATISIFGNLVIQQKYLPVVILSSLAALIKNPAITFAGRNQCCLILSQSAQQNKQQLAEPILDILAAVLADSETEEGIGENCSAALAYSAQNGQDILQVPSVQVAFAKILGGMYPDTLINNIITALYMLVTQKKRLPPVILSSLATLTKNPAITFARREQCCLILNQTGTTRDHTRRLSIYSCWS
jgi:hypothetical protein